MASSPSRHTRLVIYGDVTPAQSWSVGMSLAGGATDPDGSLLLTFLNAVDDIITTGWSAAGSIGARNSADTRVLGLRAYYYQPGESTAFSQAELPYGTPLLGTGTGSLPLQTSLVCSLLTGAPGRSNRGRMYWPMTGFGLTGHQLTTAQAQGTATPLATMLSGISQQALTVLTQRLSVTGIRGSRAVTSIRIDTIPDIQRRRVDKIGAVGQGTGVVTPPT